MSLARALAVIAILVLGVSKVDAQSLGTFRWQLQPFCDVVAVNVVQQGSIYTLDGVDEQCGAATLGSVSGLAFANPDGSIGFGLTIVRSPGGRPLHIDATISLATLSGTWRDAGGRSGVFAFNPPATPAGSPITDASVITSVAAGVGLAGGATTGGATLSVAFAGSGSAATVSRSDHEHATAQFRVSGYGTQAVPDNSVVVLNEWAVTPIFNDGGGTYSSAAGTYTVPVTGLYQVGCRARWQVFTGVLAAGARFGLGIQRNGLNTDLVLQEPSLLNTFQVQEVTTVQKFTAGEAIGCFAFQDSSAAQTVGAGTASNSGFWVIQLR